MNEITHETAPLINDLLLLAGNDLQTALNLLAGLLTSNQREFKRLTRLLCVYSDTHRIVENRKTIASYAGAESATILGGVN